MKILSLIINDIKILFVLQNVTNYKQKRNSLEKSNVIVKKDQNDLNDLV